MKLLTFTPRTSAEANRMITKLQSSKYPGHWNANTGRFEFLETTESIEQLQEDLEREVTHEFYGYYEATQLNETDFDGSTFKPVLGL